MYSNAQRPLDALMKVSAREMSLSTRLDVDPFTWNQCVTSDYNSITEFKDRNDMVRHLTAKAHALID